VDAAARPFEDRRMACELCAEAGGEVLWQSALLRIVAADEPDTPGLCRVITARHAREMTDLAAAERHEVMQAVFALETALRSVCTPDKMNLASLGNATPHLHWHVIPRWRDDAHYPSPIWCERRRVPAPRRFGAPERQRVRAALAAALGREPDPPVPSRLP